MLRLIKLLVLGAIAAVLVILGVANMAPVDLRMLPAGLGGEALTLRGIPLAGVILLSILVGVVLGEVFEWAREHKHRRNARDRAREVEALRHENAKLKRRVGGDDDDLPKIAA